MKYSKTQIDRLGQRLREGRVSESDIRTLNEYRRSFGEAYEAVVRTIQVRLGLQPTGRPAKSTSSLVEKLHRESIRLSQVQDIAGCRVIVATFREQDSVVERLREIFSNISVVDRRKTPSHGYRAVHVVVEIDGQAIEVQVRTKKEWHPARLPRAGGGRRNPEKGQTYGTSQNRDHLVADER